MIRTVARFFDRHADTVIGDAAGVAGLFGLLIGALYLLPV